MQQWRNNDASGLCSKIKTGPLSYQRTHYTGGSWRRMFLKFSRSSALMKSQKIAIQKYILRKIGLIIQISLKKTLRICLFISPIFLRTQPSLLKNTFMKYIKIVCIRRRLKFCSFLTNKDQLIGNKKVLIDILNTYKKERNTKVKK